MFRSSLKYQAQWEEHFIQVCNLVQQDQAACEASARHEACDQIRAAVEINNNEVE